MSVVQFALPPLPLFAPTTHVLTDIPQKDETFKNSDKAIEGRMTWAKIHTMAENVKTQPDLKKFHNELKVILEELSCDKCSRNAQDVEKADSCGGHLVQLAAMIDLMMDDTSDFIIDPNRYARTWASNYHSCVSRHVWRQMLEPGNPEGAYISEVSLNWKPVDLHAWRPRYPYRPSN
jgi:hypothetical protein